MTSVVPEENAIIAVAPYDMSYHDEKIAAFFEKKPEHSDNGFTAAHLFLGQPYFFEPLGEGPSGKYSAEPLYRVDQFDCVTYVDTVLALLFSENLDEFKKNMSRVRYVDAAIDYLFRTDWFTDLEWIPNLKRLGWLEDVTPAVRDRKGKPLAKTAETLIDKPNWYRVRPLKMIHRLHPVPEGLEAEKLLQGLHAESVRFSAESSFITYLPLEHLFDADQQPIDDVFDQIPSGSVIMIVRPDWSIRDHFPGFPQGYGTNLNVSHLGVAIRTPGDLMFYNASVAYAKVYAEPLTHYLKRYIDSPTIKGIHIEQVTR